MPTPSRPLRGRPKPAPRRRSDLPTEVVDELRRVARRGQADRALAHLGRGVELLRRGDVKGAVAEASSAKALAPRAAAVREILGLALYGAGRFREALSEMQAYRRISGRADQNHIIADCLRAVGRPDRAVPLAEEALTARIPVEHKAEAVIVAAAALRDQGRFEEALALLRRVPTREDVGRDWVLRLWYVTADVLEAAGRREEAASAFRRIIRHDPSAYDAAERLAQLS
ncbi:MAG TPA: tetratricopeptide repeat protein [Actinomycetota bacterium]|nr:tetratricopeptide repeat protein [Actinomycetota bacterium]